MVNTIYDYGTATRTDLYEQAKEIAREQGITGISRYTKRELADFIQKYSKPVAVEPVVVEPVVVEPITVEPVAVEPVPVKPVTVEPVAIASTSSPEELFAQKLVQNWRLSQQENLPEADKKQLWQKCFDMCELKQSELLKAYSESTVIKVHTPKFRKAIATEAGLLDESLKGGYRYTDYPMKFWSVDSGSRNEIDNHTKIATSKKKNDAQRVSIECREQLLSLANDLLLTPISDNQSVWKKALAISLLTGRRFYTEVCRHAQFHILNTVNDYNRVLGFSGQGKGSLEKFNRVYELPCYAENLDLLIENTEQVQAFVKSYPWYSDELSSQEFQSKIKSQCERALRPFNEITMPNKFLLSIKALRGLYMAFCLYDYKVLIGRHPSEDNYLGSIAGHDEVNEDGEIFYRVGTTEHYKAFLDARWDN